MMICVFSREMYSMNASQAYWTEFGDNAAVRDHDLSKLHKFYNNNRPSPTCLSAMPSDRFDSRGSSESSSGPEVRPQRRTALARHVIRHRRSSYIGKHNRHVVVGDKPAPFIRKSLFHYDVIPACIYMWCASCVYFVNIAFFSRYTFKFHTYTHKHTRKHKRVHFSLSDEACRVTKGLITCEAIRSFVSP